VLLAISREFGKSVDWLLTGEGKKWSCAAGSRSLTLPVQLQWASAAAAARFLERFAWAWRQGFLSPRHSANREIHQPGCADPRCKEESRFEQDG